MGAWRACGGPLAPEPCHAAAAAEPDPSPLAPQLGCNTAKAISIYSQPQILDSNFAITGSSTCINSVKYTCIDATRPCFARESASACRLLAPAAAPTAAYNDCFGPASTGVAEKVLMAELRSGDLVLSSKSEVARVIVNQHAEVSLYAQMLRVKHSVGSIELTPDHVLSVDGVLSPARDIKVGSLLDGARVESVETSVDAIINPLTTSGFILAAGLAGDPVVSSVHPVWIAGHMLNPAGVFLSKYSLCATLAYLFPESVQAFYNTHLEAFFASHSASLGAVAAAAPTPAALAVVAAFDVAIAGAFAASHSAAALVAIAAVALLASQARKA